MSPISKFKYICVQQLDVATMDLKQRILELHQSCIKSGLKLNLKKIQIRKPWFWKPRIHFNEINMLFLKLYLQNYKTPPSKTKFPKPKFRNFYFLKILLLDVSLNLLTKGGEEFSQSPISNTKLQSKIHSRCDQKKPQSLTQIRNQRRRIQERSKLSGAGLSRAGSPETTDAVSSGAGKAGAPSVGSTRPPDPLKEVPMEPLEHVPMKPLEHVPMEPQKRFRWSP